MLYSSTENNKIKEIKKLNNKKYRDLKNEFLRAFCWDEYEWADNFRDYARKVEELIKFKKEIEQLEIIKKALELKSLEELQEKKEHIEAVIKTLEH